MHIFNFRDGHVTTFRSAETTFKNLHQQKFLGDLEFPGRGIPPAICLEERLVRGSRSSPVGCREAANCRY